MVSIDVEARVDPGVDRRRHLKLDLLMLAQVRVLNEQFIELFDTDLVTYDHARKPVWL